MRAEEIQKLLELQQQQFQKNQSELQERQNQQLLLQQQQIAELIEKLGSKDAKQIEQDKSADYCKLNKLIVEFHCDIPRAYTFETWYEKYKTYFEIEGSTLSQELKKLLPRKLNDLKFEELIKELKEEFGDPRSKLLKRFDTLKLKCNDFENVLEFGNLVNAECEKSEMALTIEEMKILIFISGLPDCGSELKQNCIRLIENKIKKNEDCTLKDLLNDCKIFLATKKEVKLLSEPKQVSKIEIGAPPEINQIFQEPKLQSIEKKSPTKHWNNYPTNYRQPPKIPYCNHCKKDGHWTLNCYFAGRRKFSPRVNTIKISGSNENGPYCALLDIDDKKNVIQKENWIVQQLKINGNSIDMIVDTAAQITIISKDCWQEIGKPELQEISYTGSGLGNSKFNIEGKFMAKIEYKNKHEELDCHVVDGKFNLIGLPWLKKLKILKNIRIQPLIENQPSPKKKIKPIVQVNYWKGKKVLVKNKNNRSGAIGWLKGDIVGRIGKLFRIEVYCLKSIILRKIEDIKEDNSQAKNNSKKKYNVQRSAAMPFKDGSTPNKRAKILADGSDDQMISISEGTSNENEMET
uniref:Peptidase A2 domain-containing protein n=1 Tax=Meloidogyne hapla TaxID=6305 RepID=A0A1I8B2Y6_MELHA